MQLSRPSHLPFLILAAFLVFGCSGEEGSPEIGVQDKNSESAAYDSSGAEALDSVLDSRNQASDISFTDIDGVTFSLSDYRGSVVMLDFFRTDCERCTDRLDLLKELQNELHPEGVEIIGVVMNLISKDELGRIRQKRKLPFPITQGASQFNFDRQLRRSLPISYIYHPDGWVVSRIIGAQDKETYMKQIRALLNNT